MKLKHDIITREVNGIRFMVPADESTFKGVIRINDTTAFIVDCLKNDTTPEAIVDKMYEVYDAPHSALAKDVNLILEGLRNIGFLDEK